MRYSALAPRQRAGRVTNADAAALRHALALELSTGPGRAGKFGELVGENGGKYNGEVLAGRPHGRGTYFTRKVR